LDILNADFIDNKFIYNKKKQHKVYKIFNYKWVIFFSKLKHQTQYKVCDVCKSDIIIYERCFMFPMRNYLYSGDIYFKCNNGHHFYVNTIGISYETICKHFDCPEYRNNTKF
jgi:hypothetical protein